LDPEAAVAIPLVGGALVLETATVEMPKETTINPNPMTTLAQRRETR
jgi:hypothetical protein